MQNLFLNSISKFSLTAALCVALLSACGGGGGGTTEQQAYNAALANYNAAVTVADYNAAIAEFTAFKNNYKTSTRVDDADFYIARSTHELALIGLTSSFLNMPTLADARLKYDGVVATKLNKADDAQYQIGRTYYDELDYNNALIAFDLVFKNYTAPSAGDDTQYYIGRAIHEGALLALPSTQTVTYSLANARDAYGLVTAARYPGSIRLDDALYQVGRTYYDVALPVAGDYLNAFVNFKAVIDTYRTTASVADDAQYYMGRTLHQGTLLAFPSTQTVTYSLANARDAYGLVTAARYPGSIRLDDARYQIGRTYFDDLTAPNYQFAINEFQSVLDTYCATVIASASACDNAQFFKARSIHEKALLAIPTIDTAGLGLAFTEYEKVNELNYPGSVRIDDAEFYSALTYHDLTRCGSETIAMQNFVNKYSTSTVPSTVIFVADANAHIADLNINPSSSSQKHKVCIP